MMKNLPVKRILDHSYSTKGEEQKCTNKFHRVKNIYLDTNLNDEVFIYACPKAPAL